MMVEQHEFLREPQEYRREEWLAGPPEAYSLTAFITRSQAAREISEFVFPTSESKLRAWPLPTFYPEGRAIVRRGDAFACADALLRRALTPSRCPTDEARAKAAELKKAQARGR
jgi:hypothetical protein